MREGGREGGRERERVARERETDRQTDTERENLNRVARERESQERESLKSERVSRESQERVSRESQESLTRESQEREGERERETVCARRLLGLVVPFSRLSAVLARKIFFHRQCTFSHSRSSLRPPSPSLSQFRGAWARVVRVNGTNSLDAFFTLEQTQRACLVCVNAKKQNTLTHTHTLSSAATAMSLESGGGGGAERGGKQKRKAHDLNTVEESAKLPRSLVQNDGDLESAVAVFVLTSGLHEAARLASNPTKDPIAAVALAHQMADKDQPKSPEVGEIVTHVFYHGDFTPQAMESNGDGGAADAIAFVRCADETDMLVQWKAKWDQWNPAVIVGHQVQLFDLWYLISRAAELDLPSLATLGRKGAAVSVDKTHANDVLAGAGGAYSYPVQTYSAKRAAGQGQLQHQQALAATTFNRRLDVPGRAVDDVWERVQGRFTLKAYDVRTLTKNFLLPRNSSSSSSDGQGAGAVSVGTTTALVKGQQPPPPPPPAIDSELPAIAAKRSIAVLRIRHLVRSLPDIVAFCFKCKQPGHTAKHCIVGLICKNCNKPGHKVTHCPEASCTACGRKGHLATTCYKRSTCTMCGQLGHTAQFCRQVQQCASCGQTGHTVDRCFSVNPCANCGGRHATERCYRLHSCTFASNV